MQSTAILFGGWVEVIAIFLDLVFIVCLAYVGFVLKFSWAYFLISVAGGGLDIMRQLMHVQILESKSCGSDSHPA